MTTKVCTKCKEIKEISCFSTDRRTSNGLYSACRKCHSKSTKLHYENNKDWFVRWDEKHRKGNKDFYKKKAQGIVQYMIRKGEMKRLSCRECGEIETEGHHPDYSKPLEVIWFCKKHHQEAHRLLKSKNKYGNNTQ